MTKTQKILLGAGGLALATAVLLFRGPQQQTAPPGWDYCTMPSYYHRMCEASPWTRRWTGTMGCASIAICGAHTQPCQGDDGITYSMMDQNGARYYPKPQDSAGAVVIQKWVDCYVNHLDVFGTPYPCHAVTSVPGGRQAPQMLTLSQLPPGDPQIPGFCALYHCTLPICGGVAPTGSPTVTMTPSPTQTVSCPPGAVVTKIVTRLVTVVVTATKTPSFQPVTPVGVVPMSTEPAQGLIWQSGVGWTTAKPKPTTTPAPAPSPCPTCPGITIIPVTCPPVH